MIWKQMSVLLGTMRIAAVYSVWRLTGFRVGGSVLINALGDGRETVRTVAGMLLAQAGRRAKPLLERAMTERRHLTVVLTILADLGDRAVEGAIRRFRDDPDPQVAEAANQALRVLARQSS
jgi:hypothetical protein